MMNSQMKYKGYHATVKYSEPDGVFYGKVQGINDLVTFEGTSVTQLKQAFEEAVDDYLESCVQLGKQPEKEYKGQFNVRISLGLHRSMAQKASGQNISLNKFVEEAIKKAVHGN